MPMPEGLPIVDLMLSFPILDLEGTYGNLRRAALGRKLRRFRPQRNFLGLISTGDKYAVASRGAWSVEGPWVWQAKDWIDRQFMEKYNRLPAMETKNAPTVASGLADEAVLREVSAIAMRCGGCGAKVGSTVLSRVMARLETLEREDILVGLDAPDDAAVLAVPPALTACGLLLDIDDAAAHASGELGGLLARPHWPAELPGFFWSEVRKEWLLPMAPLSALV